MKLYLIFIAVFISETTSKVLPDYIQLCKRSDPEYVKCILTVIDQVKPHLNDGIPDIKVPALEPLILPKLTIDRNLEALRVKAILDKLKVHGPSSFKIKNLKIDLDKYSAEVKIHLPKLLVSGDYDVNGRLLLIPLAGKGAFQGNFTDCVTIAKGSAKIIEKKGDKYFRLDSLIIKVKVGNGHVRFVDKDGSNALIAETAQSFFNANPRLVLDIVNPIVEDTATAVVTKYVNRILGSVPISELLPED